MISLNPTSSNLLNFHPFYQPPATHKHHLPIHTRPVNAVVHGGGGGGSSFLSAIGRAIDEEEYRKARAEVHRKGFDLDGYSVEGLSIGGHETCVIVPELKSAFDIGRCPSRAVQQNFLFITHAHLDHIVCFLFSLFPFLSLFAFYRLGFMGIMSTCFCYLFNGFAGLLLSCCLILRPVTATSVYNSRSLLILCK